MQHDAGVDVTRTPLPRTGLQGDLIARKLYAEDLLGEVSPSECVGICDKL